MKKSLLLFILSLQILCLYAQMPKCGSKICHSQDNGREWRNKFTNLNFTCATLSPDGMPDLKSNYGGALTVGRTYYLHAPIANFLRFGIDATWLDLSYTNYCMEHITYWDTRKYQYHQGEFSMHVGPSITIEPLKCLALHAYFQYAPSFAGLYNGDNETFYGNYATLWVAGGNISYGPVGIGVESRFGSIKYKTFGDSDSENINVKLSGFRAYITFKY